MSTPPSVPTLVDEHALDGFRNQWLRPPVLLDLVERYVRVLILVAVGVGKSFAADRLLSHPDTYARFDLVIYVAPTWSILNERSVLRGETEPPVPWLALRPRPQRRCGSLAEEWARLERQGCAAFAKATLCRSCPEHGTCSWPHQFGGLEGTRLILGAEQHLLVNRHLVPMLRHRAKAGRVLVILDEAKLLDSSFEVVVEAEDLRRFRDAVQALARPRGIPSGLAHSWVSDIDALLRADNDDLQEGRFDLHPGLNRYAYKIQERGVHDHGPDFRYLGYDLALLHRRPAHEGWKDGRGALHFTSRPYLGCHVLLLSAHLSAEYAGHRMGCHRLPSPFASVRFRHSETGILNLKNRIGADAYFPKNHPQILDTFAVLLHRNVTEGRTTLLISRKKWKPLCAEYLEQRLGGWGLSVRIVHEGFETLPADPDPAVIPIIHYGVLGINDFEGYDAAYCLNSYYISTHELNRRVQEADPESFRVKLAVRTGPEMTRRVRLERPDLPDEDLTFLGQEYLRRLEVDPVIQAAGRVRFHTRPREVVFFHMHDLEGDVGDVEDVPNLYRLRAALGLPSAKELDDRIEVERARRVLSEGGTLEQAAGALGVSRSTLQRRLRAAERVKTPTSILVGNLTHKAQKPKPRSRSHERPPRWVG